MKLSEAIREGSKITAPGKNMMWEWLEAVEDGELTIHACALGAAHVGEYGLPDAVSRNVCDTDRLEEKHPEITEKVMNPVSLESNMLLDVIINLNDAKDWSREQVADWVESLGL